MSKADAISTATLADAEKHGAAAAFVWVLAPDASESSDMLLPKGITPRQLGRVLAEINKHLAHMQDKLETHKS